MPPRRSARYVCTMACGRPARYRVTVEDLQTGTANSAAYCQVCWDAAMSLNCTACLARTSLARTEKP